MALISEWMEQCGKKVLDNAGIVREAILRRSACVGRLVPALAEFSGDDRCFQLGESGV